MDSTVAGAAELVASTADGSAIDIDLEALVLRVAEHVEAERVVARRHPIGFLHIDLSALGGAPTAVEYRLHLWTELAPRVDGLGAIHDHGWAMTSAVLIGALEDVNYAARSTVDGGDAFVRVTYTSDGNDFTDAGTYDVAENRRRTVTAPTVYRLEAGRLHTSEVVSLPTMTLVVADRRGVGTYEPLVSVAAEAAPTHVGVRATFTPPDAAAMLRAALGR